jgi:plasmid stability protein
MATGEGTSDIMISMAQLVVRNLDAAVKAGLVRRARRNGRSMEEEVRTILSRAALSDAPEREGLGTRLARRFAGIGVDDLIPPRRRRAPRPATFDE